MSTIAAELGYIQYNVIIQHQQSWQQIGVIMESKAEVSSYCLELQKQLDIRYVAPPMPVNLTVDGGGGNGVGNEEPLEAALKSSSGPPSSLFVSFAEQLKESRTVTDHSASPNPVVVDSSADAPP
jgi:hypothetical protein